MSDAEKSENGRSISKIIGGTCVVAQNVEARTIGSAASVKTKLEIGTDPESWIASVIGEPDSEIEKQLTASSR